MNLTEEKITMLTLKRHRAQMGTLNRWIGTTHSSKL